jgi:hypothetical protein
MAELQHDRTPDQTATQSFALDGGGFLAAGAVVSIRLWTNRENDQSSELSSKRLNPAVCLAIDMLLASGGSVVQTHGRTLIVTFSGVPTAILAARRLQWAFQGLTEAEDFAGTAVAALVHGSQDLPDKPSNSSFSAPLEQATPGQILLGERASKLVDDLPGLATEAIAGSALRELLWRRPESGSSSAADEQTLFRNIKEQGRKDAGPSGGQVPDLSGNSPDAADAAAAEYPQPDDSVRKGVVGGFWAGWGKSHRLILGGSVAALVCAVGITAIALHRHPPVPLPTLTATAKPDNPTGPSSTDTPSSSPAPAEKPVQKVTSKAKPTEPDSKTHPRTPTVENAKEPTPAPDCDIGAGGIQRTLNLAESSLHAGKLDDAERGFKSILRCDRTNVRAEEGLRNVIDRRRTAR